MTADSTHSIALNRQDALKPFLKLSLGAMVLVGAVASVFYFGARTAEFEKITDAEILRVKSQVETIRAESGHLALDLMIASAHSREKYIGVESKTAHLEQEFLLLLRSVVKYDMVSLISASGHEAIRVERLPNGIVIAPEESLQSVSRQPYFAEAIHMEPREIYLSHLNLSRALGDSLTIRTPILEIATPVYLDEERKVKAVVAITCNAEKLLKLDSQTGSEFGGQLLLANSDGYWIRGLESADEWGFLFERRKDKSFENRFPGYWSRIAGASKGQFSNDSGLFTFETVTPASIIMGEGQSVVVKHTELHVVHDVGKDLEWKVISYIASRAIESRIAGETGEILVFAAGTLALLWVACWFYAIAISTQKKALGAMKQSEALNRSIIKTATEGIITIDGKGIINSFNEAAIRMFGYQARDIIGKNVKVLMSEVNAKEHDKIVNAAHCSEMPTKRVARELEGKRVDGSLFPIEIAISSFEVMGARMFTGILRDVTEQKRAAAEIELLALFPNNNPAPVLRVDFDGKILQKNPAAESLFGILSDNSKKLSEIIPELDQATIESCLKSGKAISRSAEVLGRSYLLLLKGIPSRNVCQLYAMDVTERNEALVVAAEFGRLLDDSVNEVYIADVETLQLRMANKKACANLGYDFDEMMELSLKEIQRSRPGTASMKSQIERLLEGSQCVAQFVANHIRKDGTEYLAELTVQLSTFRSKPVFVTFAVDITDKIGAEKTRERGAVEELRT